jgi:hypothetical protein
MDLPPEATVDELAVQVDGQAVEVSDRRIRLDLPPGPAHTVKVSYRSAGQDEWTYRPGQGDQALLNLKLSVSTNFRRIDYPADGLSPTTAATPNGDSGVLARWEFTRMLPARNRTIGVLMPSKQPAGELSARISRFAPVSLFFFLTVMVTIQLVRNLKLHPMNYLLIAAGFFAFHILLAYLVDHFQIHLSFWICSGVSVFLVVSYLRLVLGWRVALLYAGLAQLVYLVFFSYAFFWHGWTGLTVVIGAVVTLFVIMQLTGRIDWDEKLPDMAGRRDRLEPLPSQPSEDVLPQAPQTDGPGAG